ncbi:MAG: type II secretion system protein GspC [Hyphomicrobiales bacterium]
MVNRYFNIANLLLLTTGVYFGVSIFYAILTARLDSAPPSLSSTGQESSVSVDAPSSLADYQVIVDRNLFNSGRQPLSGPGKGAGPELDVDKLKQTEMKLKLWGTFIGPDGQSLYAVIEDQKTREQLPYRPGDTIQNASVKLVLRQKVVLTVNGRDEVLGMEEPGLAKSGAPGPGRADASATGRLPAAEPAQQITVSSEQVEHAMENLGELLNQATFRPYVEDGKPAGISITGIKPNAIFRKLRLRNGDVITGVNGQSIASVEDAMKVFGNLSTEGPLQVKVKRRGQEETLEYKIE